MKGSISFVLLVLTLLLSANVGFAAFPIKKASPSPENIAASPMYVINNTAGSEVRTRHHSFFSRLVHKILKPAAVISQPLYIVLSVFFLGWLAMGINENFEGWDWVICLGLYILFWLPGFIFSLIMMSKFY